MEIIFTPEFYENDVLIVSTIMNNLSKKDKLNLLYIFISMILGGIFTALFCLRDKNKNKNNKKEIKLEEYLDKGNLELKNLLEEDISDERLEEITKEFIEEITPNGLVRLSYNKDKESFTYYSNEDIAYKYLEVVSRLFVIKYNVKKLYINYVEELIKARDIKLKKNINLTTKENSIYAISKNKKLPENTEFYISPEKSNTYIKLGKIKDLIEEENKKSREINKENKRKDISFKEFKKLQN
jgi:hypothetical protein